MEIGITITDLDGTIIYTNPVDAMIHGWSVDELIGKKSRIFGPREMWRSMTAEEIDRMGFLTRETINIRKDGTTFPVRLTSDIVRNEKSEPLLIVNACVDLSGRRKVEETLLKLSITDPLTGLFNRRYFDSMIAQEVNRAKRVGYPVSLIMLDLDEFKAYNDTRGHLAGDDILIGVAGIVSGSIRKDTDTACRYGGDEFVVILPNSDEEKALCVAYRIARRVLESFGEVSVSVGVAGLGENDSEKELIHAADMAMYAEKGSKRQQRFSGDDEPWF
jgi:diguanylate cyclase (GGDEF)-like protein/PAS domain S-box-containing protein